MNAKDKQIAALQATIAEQQETIRELVRHQARVTGRSVEEYLDALKAKDIVEALQLLLDKANARLLKVRERQEKHRANAQHYQGKTKEWIETSVYAVEALNELQRVNMWIPVGGALPDPHEYVTYLVCVDAPIGGVCIYFGSYFGGNWVIEVPGNSRQPANVTHWRPLPVPPQATESEVGN